MCIDKVFLCLIFSRTSVSALAGMSAGVLGLTGLSGFIFYFAASIFLSVSLLSTNNLSSHSKSSLHFYKKMLLLVSRFCSC